MSYRRKCDETCAMDYFHKDTFLLREILTFTDKEEEYLFGIENPSSFTWRNEYHQAGVANVKEGSRLHHRLWLNTTHKKVFGKCCLPNFVKKVFVLKDFLSDYQLTESAKSERFCYLCEICDDVFTMIPEVNTRCKFFTLTLKKSRCVEYISETSEWNSNQNSSTRKEKPWYKSKESVRNQTRNQRATSL